MFNLELSIAIIIFCWGIVGIVAMRDHYKQKQQEREDYLEKVKRRIESEETKIVIYDSESKQKN